MREGEFRIKLDKSTPEEGSPHDKTAARTLRGLPNYALSMHPGKGGSCLFEQLVMHLPGGRRFPDPVSGLARHLA